MARLPQAFIDQVLDRTDIVDVVDRRVKLKKAGKNYSACCPFHQEKTPSFSVNPEKQFYYCFGCGAGGNALRLFIPGELPRTLHALLRSHALSTPRSHRGTRAARAHSIAAADHGCKFTFRVQHQLPAARTVEQNLLVHQHLCSSRFVASNGVQSTISIFAP